MFWRCLRCGSPNRAADARCAICGAPAAGPGATSPLAPGATLPLQPGAPPAAWDGRGAGFGGPVGVVPGGRVAPAGRVAPRPAAQKSASRWGCGIAGCLGVLAVLVVAVAGLVGLGLLQIELGPDETASADDDDDDDDAAAKKTKKKRASGSLRSQLPKRVGAYSLEEVKTTEVAGAVDGLVATYRSGSAVVEYAVAVFPDEDAAKKALLAAAGRAHAETGVEGTTRKIQEDDGSVTGLASHFDADPEVLVYRIDKLMAVVFGPRGEVVPFFEKLPL